LIVVEHPQFGFVRRGLALVGLLLDEIAGRLHGLVKRFVEDAVDDNWRGQSHCAYRDVAQVIACHHRRRLRRRWAIDPFARIRHGIQAGFDRLDGRLRAQVRSPREPTQQCDERRPADALEGNMGAQHSPTLNHNAVRRAVNVCPLTRGVAAPTSWSRSFGG